MEGSRQGDDVSREDTVAAPSAVAATEAPTAPFEGAPAAAGAILRARADRYKLGALLGKGGMGEVIAAVDEDIGRDVAVKRLRTAAASPEAIARFLREARIQARLDHPAIVPVHDLGIGADGRPFFAMKRLAGITLLEILARRAEPEIAAKFPRTRLLRAFVDVCLAVELAHTRGVVHRDLKPANVVLGDFGEVYVLDWGIARVLDSADHPAQVGASVGADVATLDTGGTSVGAVLGTPGYMPPEQLRGDADLDHRADVYALGALLFEILTGEALHPRGAAALASTLGGADARPGARGVECAPELEAACVRATRLAPAERFATARELGDAVQRYLDGDRDLQLRRHLAADHVAAAEAALAAGTSPEGRAAAMREAGRALALDPTSTSAAAVVGRLMLEPPKETPPEVTAEIAETERVAALRQGRLAVRALAAYTLFIPFLFWLGVRDWSWVFAFYGVIGAAVLQAWIAARRGAAVTPVKAAMIVAVNVAIVLLLSRLLGPYVLVPALGAGVMAGMATFPPLLDAFPLVFGAFALSVIVPAVLEHAGVWARTTAFEGGVMVVRSSVIELTWRTEAMILFGIVVLFYVAGRFSHSLAIGNRDAHRRLQLHAWHLRQLVPADAAPRPPAPDPAAGACAIESLLDQRKSDTNSESTIRP